MFSGNDIKALKYNLDLFGRSKLMGLNVNPSVVSTAAPLGSIGMNYLTGSAYIKTGTQGTDWSAIATGSGFVPYTGATGNVDLGNYSIRAGGVPPVDPYDSVSGSKNLFVNNVSGFVLSGSASFSNVSGSGIAYGSETIATGTGTGLTSNLIGTYAQVYPQSASGTTTAVGVQSYIEGSSDIGAAIAFKSEDINSSGTITNAIGFQIANMTSGTNRYSIFTEQMAGTNYYSYYGYGNAKSYFGGNVGIGNTAPNVALDVTGAGEFTSYLDSTALYLPNTTSGTDGTIYMNGERYIHSYTNVSSGQGENLFWGKGAGNKTLSATYGLNIGMGQNSLQSLTSGYSNVGVGFATLKNTTSGIRNVAIGDQALLSNTDGNSNMAIGDHSMGLCNGSGCTFNMAIGEGALQNVTTSAVRNVAVGPYAVYTPTSTNDQTAVGFSALRGVTTGVGSVAVGSYAGYSPVALEGGSYNTFIGTNAAPSAGWAGINFSGCIGYNCQVGRDYSLILGSPYSNMRIGIGNISTPAATLDIGVGDINMKAMTAPSLSSGANFKAYVDSSDNTLKGSINGGAFSTIFPLAAGGTVTTVNSGNGLTGGPITLSGTLSVDVGMAYGKIVSVSGASDQLYGINNAGTALEMKSVVAGSGISIASSAGAITITATGVAGNPNIVSLPATVSAGYGVILQNNSPVFNTFGTDNLFIGKNSGNFTTSGSGLNVCVGAGSCAATTTGLINIALGYQANQSVQDGSDNIAIGYRALNSNVSASHLIGIGNQALGINTGASNLAIGYGALSLNTTGTFNAAVGENALATNASGLANTTMGHYSNYSGTTDGNSSFGFGALRGITSGSGHNTGIGRDAGYKTTPLTTGSYSTFLGADSHPFSGALTYATAVGAGSIVGRDYATVLGPSDSRARVGIGIISSPQATIDIPGDINLLGIAAPSVASVNNSKIYYDLASNQIMASISGAAFAPIYPVSGAAFPVQASGTVFAGPVSGADAAPSFRQVKETDLVGYARITAISDAVNAGLAFSPTTNKTHVAYYRREGAYMMIDGQITQTGTGAAGSVTINIASLPGSPTIATAYLPGGTGATNASQSQVGYAHVWTGSAWTVYHPVYATTTTFQLVSGGTRLGGTTYASGAVINYNVKLPITGWNQ